MLCESLDDFGINIASFSDFYKSYTNHNPQVNIDPASGQSLSSCRLRYKTTHNIKKIHLSGHIISIIRIIKMKYFSDKFLYLVSSLNERFFLLLKQIYIQAPDFAVSYWIWNICFFHKNCRKVLTLQT
jgi:hypothetical protein